MKKASVNIAGFQVCCWLLENLLLGNVHHFSQLTWQQQMESQYLLVSVKPEQSHLPAKVKVVLPFIEKNVIRSAF